MPDRLEMVVSGQREVALATTPSLVSKPSHWDGFLMEQHQFRPMEMPDHWIPFYMVGLQMVKAPASRFFFEGGKEHRTAVQRGDCVVVSPHEVRKFRFTGEGNMLLVSIEPAVLQNMLAGAPGHNSFELLRRWNGDDPVLRTLILRLQADLAAGCPGGPLLGESICTSLAEELVSRYSLDRPRVDHYQGGLSRTQLKRVREFIDLSLEMNLTCDKIAAVAGVSRYHFGKAFKESTGVTLHSYVLARRMWRAQELLAKSCLSLAGIAQTAGFSSQSHFTSTFSTRMGISPGAYRNMTKRLSVAFREGSPKVFQKAAKGAEA